MFVSFHVCRVEAVQNEKAHAEETPCQFAKTLSSQSTLIFHVPIPLGHLDRERKLDAGGQWTHTRTTAKGPLAIGLPHRTQKTIRPTQKKGLVLDVHEILFDGYSYFQKGSWWQDTFTQPKKRHSWVQRLALPAFRGLRSSNSPPLFSSCCMVSTNSLRYTWWMSNAKSFRASGPVIFHHMR